MLCRVLRYSICAAARYSSFSFRRLDARTGVGNHYLHSSLNQLYPEILIGILQYHDYELPKFYGFDKSTTI